MKPNKDVYNPNKFMHWIPELKRIKKGELVSPSCMQIDLTNACNSKCNFCYYQIHDHVNEFKKADKLLGTVVLRAVQEFKDIGGKCIETTGGGEPLLAKYYDIYSQTARELGLQQALVTNGILLNKHIDEVVDDEGVRVSLKAGDTNMHERVQGINGEIFYMV